MNKRSRPKATPGSLYKLDDSDAEDHPLQLPDYLHPWGQNMFRYPSKHKIHDGAYGREQLYVKDQRERKEVARLRRLADVRAAVDSNRPSMPPHPQGSASSTPNLHDDFATNTHTARLDVAYEKLEAYVEKSVEQLIVAMKEQRQRLEERMDSCLEGVDEKITLMVGLPNETRSGSGMARNRHSGGHNVEACDKMRAELLACHTRLEKLETRANQAAKDATEAATQADVQEKQSEIRLKLLEERIGRLEAVASGADGQTRATIDAAIAEMVRESKDKADTAEKQVKVSDTRAEAVQALLADLNPRMEAEQNRTKILDSHVEGLQTAVGQFHSFFEEARTTGHLQSVVAELSSRLETEQARTQSRLDALQEQLVGSMATSGRMSVLEERVHAIANSANEARASAGDVRSAAMEILCAVDNRVASIDGLRTDINDIVTRVQDEQSRAWKRIDEVQERIVSKSYIDERLNVVEWIMAEQLRGPKRLDEMFEHFMSKAYIDEYPHGGESRLQHVESVHQQESAAPLAAPSRSDFDDVFRRLGTE